MEKSNKEFIELDSRAEKMLRNAEYLGCGHNGIVFLLSNNRILKIFKEKKICRKEYEILKRTHGSKYFPKVYQHGDYYIVREFIGGERLDKYIKDNGFRKEVGRSLLKLIDEFEKLKFSKLDIRCKDLYIDENFFIRVIDPKNNYSKKVIYPRHLMKGLNNLGVLNEFLEYVKTNDVEKYRLWSFRMKQYLDYKIK